MKKRFYSLFLGLAAMSVFMGMIGCGNETQSTGKEHIQEGTQYSEWSSGILSMSDGLVVQTNSPKGSQLMLFDYQTDTFAPLCADPNCLHNSRECESVYLARKGAYIGLRKDEWAYYTIEQDGYGAFYTCSLDGSNEKKIGDFAHIGALSPVSKAIFTESTCFFATCEDQTDPKTEEWTGTISGIYSYDLETGKEKQLTESKEYMRPAFSVLGLYKDQLYYSEWDGSTYLIKCVDLKSGDIKDVITESGVINVFGYGKYIVYARNDQETTINQLDLGTMKTEHVITEGIGVPCLWTEELKIFGAYKDDSNEGILYEWRGEKDEPRPFRRNNRESIFEPFGQSGDKLIGQIRDPEKEYTYAIMTTTDFLNGTDNWTKLSE